MIRTVEAVIDADGTVHALESVGLGARRRALGTLLGEEPAIEANETAMLSESALAADWSRPEEDQAWAYLQPVR